MIIISSFLFAILQNFVFGGRLIFGPDAWSIPFTILLIITPVIFFSIFVATHLHNEFLPNNSAGHVFFVGAILISVFVSLLPIPHFILSHIICLVHLCFLFRF